MQNLTMDEINSLMRELDQMEKVDLAIKAQYAKMAERTDEIHQMLSPDTDAKPTVPTVSTVSTQGTLFAPVVTAGIVTPTPESLLKDGEPKNDNGIMAAWMRPNGLDVSSRWQEAKTLMASYEGEIDYATITATLLGGTVTVPPKAVKVPKAKGKAKAAPKAKVIHPPIACGDCGTIVQEPKWNQRYCPEHSAERSNVFQSMLDKHRAAAK